MRIPVVVNDTMQRGYAYDRTQPIGRNFDPAFAPELTPKQMLELGVFGGKYMTDCRREFPASWFRRAKLSVSRRDPRLNFFKVNASLPLRGLAAQRLDSPAGSPRLVSVVLPVRHGPADVGRPAANPSLARDCAARGGDPKALRQRRCGVPAAAAPGGVALGV